MEIAPHEKRVFPRKPIRGSGELVDPLSGNKDPIDLADISVGYALGLADMLELGDVSDAIKAYAKRLTSRPAYQRAEAVA